MKTLEYKDIEKNAEEIAKTIVIRDYINGNSKDTRRSTTTAEQVAIYKVAKGALMSLRNAAYCPEEEQDCCIRSIITTAEWVYSYLFEEIHPNTYDSIYCPLKKIADELKAEQEA